MTDWHPRKNAYSVAWEFRNGSHDRPYATMRWLPNRTFELRGSNGEDLGVFTSADDAAVYAWNWYLTKVAPASSNAPNGQA